MEEQPHKPHSGVFTFYAGLCPASEVLQCCKEGGPGGEICYGQSDNDKCINRNEICDKGIFIEGETLCPSKSTSCCLHDPQGLAKACSRAGGQCTSSHACQAVHGSQSLPGKCPGTNLITCCIYPTPGAPIRPSLPGAYPIAPIVPSTPTEHITSTSTSSPVTPTVTPITPVTIPPNTEPHDPQKDADLDDCMSCQFLFDQLKNQQIYASRQWYYITLAQWCGVDGSVYGLRGLRGGVPLRTSVGYNLYPTCIKLFGSESAVVDDTITQLLDGWGSDQICRSSHLCLLSSTDTNQQPVVGPSMRSALQQNY